MRSAPADKRDVLAVWKPKPSQKIGMRTAGQTPVNFHELRSGEGRFRDAITSAAAASPHGAAVEVKESGAYSGNLARTFITPDNKAGFALIGDNIVSLFKHPDAGIRGFSNSAISLATQNGGRRLDAFDTVLPGLYSENGFRAVARLPWNDKYAPPGWDYQKFAAFNGGRPDVVFMVYDPAQARAYKPGDGKRVASYDEGVAAQTEAIKAMDAAHAAREEQIPSAKPPPAPTTAMTQTELFPGKFPDLPAPKKKVEADDFAKDRVGIDSYTERDEKRLDKFVEVWNDHVGEAPADFKKEFLGGIPGTMNIRFQYSEDPRTGEARQNTMEIDGKLQDAQGTNIGSYTRTIDFVENKAESDYFALNNRTQGKNLGKQMLAANVAMYQKMGIDSVEVHADIDVGGYAWAKYGYVPTEDSWYGLQGYLSGKLGRGGGAGYEPMSWEEMTSDEQDNIFEKWKDYTESDFRDMEIESWRESGGDLAQAKTDLAQEFEVHQRNSAIGMGHGFTPDGWAMKAVQDLRKGSPESLANITDDEILAAITLDFDDRHGDGEADPDINVDEEKTKTLSDTARDVIARAMVDAFNKQAESNRGDIDPPDYLSENIADHQSEIWDQMTDAEKYRWAEKQGELPTREDEGEVNADETDRESIQALIDDNDPKAIWAIADSKLGKDLLLNSDWNGTLDLHDRDTMERFNAYVGLKPKEQPVAQAA